MPVPRRRFDQEQSEFGHAHRLLDQEDRADQLAVVLRDPATLAVRVEILDELRRDFRDQGLEAARPSRTLGNTARRGGEPPSPCRRGGACGGGKATRGAACCAAALDRPHRADQRFWPATGSFRNSVRTSSHARASSGAKVFSPRLVRVRRAVGRRMSTAEGDQSAGFESCRMRLR